jgi:hypothetical protein
MSFDTPGSQTNRQIEAALDLKPERITVNLKTPFKQIDVDGKLQQTTPNNYKAEVKLTTDKKQTYDMEGTFKVCMIITQSITVNGIIFWMGDKFWINNG